MSEHDDHEADLLRARLRAADPAASLPAADRAWVGRLLEDVMSTEPTTETRETGVRERSRLTWLVAAAAVVVIAGVAIFALVGRDDGTQTPPSADGVETVTDLTGPDEAAYQARCAAPTAALIEGHELAFDGTVTTVADGVVTLDPTRWYAGEETDLVRVQAPDEQLRRLLVAVDFEAGGRYLVAASDGQVAICGQSGPWTQQLADLYAEAFGG